MSDIIYNAAEVSNEHIFLLAMFILFYFSSIQLLEAVPIVNIEGCYKQREVELHLVFSN